MKIIAVILDIILAFMILFIVVGSVFIGWEVAVDKRMTLADKADYYYATEIKGENEIEYWIGSFIDDVTDLFD